MSSLIALKPEFIQYLYKNNIKLETYESPVNDKIISGFWAFLDKYENKYFTRMLYYINKQCKSLRVSFITSQHSVSKDVKKVAYITILYLVSIYSISDRNNINFDNFEYDCFLCANKECMLCKNDIYNIITENSLLSKLQSTLISSTAFDTRFIRNFLYKNEYKIFTQESLRPDIPEEKIIYQNFHDPRDNIDCVFGNIKLSREKEIINIDYTLSSTKKILSMTIKECTFEKHTLTLFEMLILHFISRYSNDEIMVRFPSHKKYIEEYLYKIGFNNTNDEKDFYVIFNFVDLKEPCIILKTKYEEILPYIQDKWNIVKDI